MKKDKTYDNPLKPLIKIIGFKMGYDLTKGIIKGISGYVKGKTKGGN